MVDRETFDRRLGRLEQLLRDLRGLSRVAREQFLVDRGVQAQAERWLQLAGETCVDLATQLIAERGWRTPVTYRETFKVLAEEGVVDHELASEMAGWASLRNVLVHLYLEVDHERLYEVIHGELDGLAGFAAAINAALD